MRDSIVIYRSYMEAIKELDKDSGYDLLIALLEYGMDDKEPELSGIATLADNDIKNKIKEAETAVYRPPVPTSDYLISQKSPESQEEISNSNRGLSNRELLANALDSAAQTEKEKMILAKQTV